MDVDGELNDRQRRALTEHLEVCSACRAHQRQLAQMRDGMSRLSALTAESGASSEWLLPNRRRHLPRWAAGLTAAAAVLAIAAVGWWSLGSPAPGSSEHVVKHDGDAHPSEQTKTPPLPDVQVTFGSDVIAVPMKSKNPNVTILWIYENVRKLSANDAKSGAPSSRSEKNHETTTM
jgi:hypothetical protein